ncbi:tetratricopeptide repeat protein [Rhodopirellula sp. ICT_H3.1]|uniref:Tetratricopeptide repeat protein n=2 Tax=Aporhodopirellula aestuarii TaxID=2950107 RepID=A0ABT0TX84_9BACT|nr:tetratricopeptide repeat protein [Aporhodopirellula aestuarii]
MSLVASAQTYTPPVSQPSAGQLKMLSMMQQRVADSPHHSESWRMLAKLQFTLGQPNEAIASARRAVEEDPHNAAAHFDIGQFLEKTGEGAQSKIHYDRVFQIAPQSSYAAQLRELGLEAPPTGMANLQIPRIEGAAASAQNATDLPDLPFGRSAVQPASYEIQTFDGSDDVELRLEQLEAEVRAPANRLRVFMKTGVLYNSNVTLTPISRELAQSDSGSFQGFANPDIDWKWLRTDTMRAGPLFRGYYTVNEAHMSDFDLASYQPGGFFERDFKLGSNQAIGRIDYVFSADFFDGNAVGTRHSGTTSLTLIRPDLDAIYLYFTLAQSDFEDDGTTPLQTSLDGTTITTGVTRFFQTGWERLPMHALGIDLESADTEGADYRYLSYNLHGSTSWKISPKWELIPTWGIGYRDYGDYTGTVDRSEFFWRAHARLQYQWNDRLSIAAVCGHDRFASDNDDFDTERTEGGIEFTFTR